MAKTTCRTMLLAAAIILGLVADAKAYALVAYQTSDVMTATPAA